MPDRSMLSCITASGTFVSVRHLGRLYYVEVDAAHNPITRWQEWESGTVPWKYPYDLHFTVDIPDTGGILYDLLIKSLMDQLKEESE